MNRGTVENIRFTQGCAGNQWTTIDGKRYATWWDARKVDWKVGDSVTFRHYRAPLWSGQPNTDCADHIRRSSPTVIAGVTMSRIYAHMCRDQHIDIGHNDSGDELCPLCQALDALEQIFQVCLDNEGPTVRHDLVLKFVKDVAAKTHVSLSLPSPELS